jgi:hypothetical protein
MQSRSKFVLAGTIVAAMLLFGQKLQKPSVSVSGAPSEPIPPGTCTSSTFGYLELGGRRAGFTDEDLGKAIQSALRQGYVLTIYPPTKSGIFLNQECHGASK